MTGISVKLNKQQLQAVRHKEGPLLIIAGAGTGKTTVVTERIKYLIEKQSIKPSEILALTFTEKAAREMEERVDMAMPYGYTQMWISTFHSFCDRVLRAEALHIGLNPRFKLMTEAETTQLIRNNLFKFDLNYFRPLGNPTKFVSGMLQHFSRLQDEDVSPEDYLKWAKKRTRLRNGSGEAKQETEKWLELANAYKIYDEIKLKEGLMDFGDLIVRTLHLLRERKNILNHYRKQFKYVLVDEFQDTNFAQNELAMLLSGKGKRANITVTGDDDQSVYRFRGAAVSNIIQFRKNYPSAKVVVLTKNYRSTQVILDRAYDLIQHNNPDRLEVVEKVDKKLVSEINKKGDKISFIHVDRVENEAVETIKEIVNLIRKGHEYKDIAILVRANNHAEPFVRALQRHSVPYQFLGPGKLLKQSEIVDLISYLRVLYNPDDSLSTYRLLSADYLEISGRDIITLSNYAKGKNISLLDACKKVGELKVSKNTKNTVELLLKTIDKHFRLIKKDTAGQILYYFLEEMNLLDRLINPDSVSAEKITTNISKFFDKLKSYEVNHEDATVPAVVDWLELSSELGESPLAANSDWTEVNAVNILTVHSAKGLEFPVVFLVNLVSQRFPTIERREQIPIPDELIKEVLPEGDYHMQEERRLFYVGMTRAKERLYLTAANYYGEGVREKRLSSYIFEALGDDATSAEHQIDNSKQLTFLDYKDTGVSKLTTNNLQPIHIDFLSYSQIQTFQICPLHYKLRYILKIPTSPSAALSFGTSMHETMNDIYLSVKSGSKPTVVSANKLLKTNWVNEGYKSKGHETKMLEKGKTYLKEYLKDSYDSKIKTIALEQPFVLSLDPTSHKATRGQPPDRRLKIGGKIDRIDKILWPATAKAKARQGIEIIDYKTGERVPTQREVDKNEQLTFYALAASRINGAPFGIKLEKIKLSLYYFEGQQKLSTTRTKEQLDEFEKELFEWRKKIEGSDFVCSNNYLCRSCEFKMMCGVD